MSHKQYNSLDEIIKLNDIENVSNQTCISVSDLKKILEKDFEGFHSTKLLT